MDGMRFQSVAVMLSAACLYGEPAPVQKPDLSQADSLAGKIELIRERDREGHGGAMDFAISETEVNAYLRYRLKDQLPQGIEEPWVVFTEGSVEAGASLDLALLRERLPLDSVLQFLSGQVPVEASADVSAENGTGKLDIQKFIVGGIELPKSFLQQILSSNTLSSSRPNGIQLDEPFALPYGISSARILTGLLVLRQDRASSSKAER